jgi:hypothetical protein
MIMDFTQEMFGIFNVETGELLRGPFKSVRGASNSKSAVIDSALQRYMLADDKNYHLYLSWHRGIDPSFLESRYPKNQVDDLFEILERLDKEIQVRPVVVTMGELKS